jgi:hypothetical protein
MLNENGKEKIRNSSTDVVSKGKATESASEGSSFANMGKA